MAFMWYTQEFGYKAGSRITDDLSGGLLQDITKGASILGMFILGSLVNRWVSVKFAPVVSSVKLVMVPSLIGANFLLERKVLNKLYCNKEVVCH